jgi:hypothetical protein
VSVSIQQLRDAFSRTAARTDQRALARGPADLLVVETVEQSVAKLRAILLGMVMTGLPINAAGLLSMEKGLHARVAAECLDPFVASVIQAAHNDTAVILQAEAIVAATPGLRPQRSGEATSVTLLGGSKATIESSYYLPMPRGKPQESSTQDRPASCSGKRRVPDSGCARNRSPRHAGTGFRGGPSLSAWMLA